MDEREVEVPEQQHERRVEEAVVEDDGARKAETRVALTEPEQQARGEEEDEEGGREGRVELLRRIEARLLVRPPPPQPVDVLGGEQVELARRPQQAAPVAEQRDERQRGDPADPAPEVDVLDERPPPDVRREVGQVEDQPGREQEEEAGCVDPVQRPLGARETADVPRPQRPHE
jgi:hypothetical protein